MGVREACEQDERVRGGETHDDDCFGAFGRFFFCVEEQERTLFSRKKKLVRKQESCKEDVTVFISRNHANLRVVTLRVEAGSRSPFPFGIASPWRWY